MPKNKKIFVLDTSVLLYSAKSLTSFSGNDVVIPYVVLEELDRFKTRDDITGSNARQVARSLNDLRKQGRLNEGVSVNEAGGKLYVELNYTDSVDPRLDVKQNDDRILNVCLGLAKRPAIEVCLVTKDINLAVRADVFGITAEDFNTDQTVSNAADLYTGSLFVEVSDELIDAFYQGEKVFPEDLEVELFPNQYLNLVGVGGKSALARSTGPLKPLAKLRSIKKDMWGIVPRNREQHFAMDALLNPDIKLISLTGAAGTGKTLCALACALYQVQDTNSYSRLVVSRPVQPLGKDIGFLPGDIHEKMAPWMGPIKDSLEFLTRGRDKSRDIYEDMLHQRMLEVEPLTYIRGRSMPDTIFILDEAQDMTRPEIKTLVSRMGENSKLVLIGDVLQISNPYLDSTSSGLSNVVEKFKSYEFAAHVTLTKGERSELATVASEIL